jgi:hypothetical protein
MKLNNIILFILSASLILSGCRDEEVVRFPEFQDGVNLRISVDPAFSFLNADDLAGAKVQFSLYSENDDLQEVELSMVYYNFSQDSTYPATVWKTYGQGDFSDGAILNEVITAQSIASLYGIDQSLIGGGDRIDIANQTTLTDGRVFPSATLPDTRFEAINISPSIQGSPASGAFSTGFTAFVACPISQSFATGTYLLEQVSGPPDYFFGGEKAWGEMEVSIDAVNLITRSFSPTYYTFDVDFSFLLVCGNILVGTTSAGLSCGGAGLAWQATNPPPTFDLASDESFEITLLENPFGDCGIPVNEPTTLRFTKQ